MQQLFIAAMLGGGFFLAARALPSRNAHEDPAERDSRVLQRSGPRWDASSPDGVLHLRRSFIIRPWGTFINGLAPPASAVRVNGEDVVVESNGEFSARVYLSKPGDNRIVAEALDLRTGIRSEASLVLNFPDFAAEETPEVDPATVTVGTTAGPGGEETSTCCPCDQ